jgi:hypothetical protein
LQRTRRLVWLLPALLALSTVPAHADSATVPRFLCIGAPLTLLVELLLYDLAIGRAMGDSRRWVRLATLLANAGAAAAVSGVVVGIRMATTPSWVVYLAALGCCLAVKLPVMIGLLVRHGAEPARLATLVAAANAVMMAFSVTAMRTVR